MILPDDRSTNPEPAEPPPPVAGAPTPAASAARDDERSTDPTQMRGERGSDPSRSRDEHSTDPTQMRDEHSTDPTQMRGERASERSSSRDDRPTDPSRLHDERPTDPSAFHDERPTNPSQVRSERATDPVPPGDEPVSIDRVDGFGDVGGLAAFLARVRASPPPPGDARLGAIVGGKFRIEELIGSGGMGRVYRATHLSLGEPVAVKFLRGGMDEDPEFRARFRREAVALARLRHPGVIAVHDFGEHEGALYLVMELVRGELLVRHMLNGGEPMGVERVVGISDQILQVLQAAHQLGIVHRDLKPDNVMLLDAGDGVDHVKVLDFGLAYVEEPAGGSRLTATNAVQGTAAYMSPEQCRAQRVTPASDIYSFGVMLFEMLAGALPFDAGNMAEFMAQHMFVEPPSIADAGIHRKVPPGVEAVALWCLAKSPEARPTAAQAREALAAALAGTDQASRADASVRERLSLAGSDRVARGLPRPSMSDVPTLVRASPAEASDGEGPRVVLWGFPPARATSLRSALALHGIASSPWDRAENPPGALGDHAVRAVLVAGDGGAVPRTQSLRSDPRVSRIPVVVVDLADSLATPDLVRAGASDVVVQGAGDGTLGTKLLRLMKRRR